MDGHASPAGIKRLWNVLRQKRYQRVRRPVLLALPPETHAGLKDFL